MKVDNQDYYAPGEVLANIRSFIRYLRKRWLTLALVMLAGAGLGMVYYLRQVPKYEAVTTFILEEKSAGGGGLAGLASQFGFNVGSLGSGGSIFSGDNILEILKSKKVVQKVLLSKADETKPDGKTLADLYLDFTGIKKSWQKKISLGDIGFSGVQDRLSPVQDSILNVVYKLIVRKSLVTQRTSKQSSIITVQVTAPDDGFARLMTIRLVEEASKLYMDIRVGTAQENIRQLQRRSDSLLALLNNKSFNAAAILPLDVNPGIRTASVPVEIATRDKTVLATLYAEVTKNLEASKMLLSQQTPVIELLDKPAILMEDSKKGLVLLLVIPAIAGAVIYGFVALLLFYIGRMESQRPAEISKAQ